MEIFIKLKRSFRIVGYMLFNHPQAKLINIIQIVFCTSFQIMVLLTHIWFFLFEAKTFSDFADSFLFCSISILTLLTYSVFLWERRRVLSVITEIESLIDKS